MKLWQPDNVTRLCRPCRGWYGGSQFHGPIERQAASGVMTWPMMAQRPSQVRWFGWIPPTLVEVLQVQILPFINLPKIYTQPSTPGTQPSAGRADVLRGEEAFTNLLQHIPRSSVGQVRHSATIQAMWWILACTDAGSTVSIVLESGFC